MKRFLFPILILFFTVLIMPRDVKGQSIALSVSPPILELMIQPGKNVNQEFSLTNLGEDTFIRINIAELSTDGLEEIAPENRLPWLEVSLDGNPTDKPLLVRQDEKLKLNLRINPGQNIEQKDYYRALTFTTIPYPHDPQTQVKVSQTIASLLLIGISSQGLPKKAEIISKIPRLIDSFDSLIFDITLRNSGHAYFRPNGSINLYGPLAKAQYRILPQVIMVNQERKLLLEKKNQPVDRIKGFLLGRYRLETDFVLDEGTIQVKDVKTFYAVPWKATLLILLSWFVFRFIRKARNKKKGNRKI